MASIDQVISQIRFGLEQLSARNAHHEFEHLCRHLARARICSNILPATGPVAAGGDQGRDFETFRTFLNSTSIANSTFVGLASTKPIAFACSLEDKKSINRKIKSDVKTITASGATVEGIQYFASADITVAARHKLQAWAQNTHQVGLEVYDGNAIAELLGERDVFWIAERFLNIPAEIFPPIPSENETWYGMVLSDWKGKTPSGKSFPEFVEIRLAARQAFLKSDLRQDLPFWINLIESNFLTSPFDAIRRRSIYEVCFLNLRGLNSLEGYEDLLRGYFSDLDSLSNPTDLEDARVLASYCTGALGQGVVGLSFDEVSAWQHKIIGRIDQRLAETVHPNVEAALLSMKGWTHLMVDPLKPERPRFEKAIEWWLKLAEMVESAPMFPLQQFASNITELLELMLEVNSQAEIPRSYFDLTNRLDDLLAKRVGGFSAAESCHKRANVLYEQGRILDAIDLLHESKIDWYAAETLDQSLSIMLLLSMAYMKLGLLFAAKYYALAVAFIGMNNSQPEAKSHASFALMRAATWDYILGAFCGFLNLTEIEIPIHQAHAHDAGDLDKSPELHSIVFHLMTLKALSERVNPEFDSIVTEKINAWLPKTWIDQLLPRARKNLEDLTDEELLKDISNELLGPPFGDSSAGREIRWSALGVEWHVAWKNDYSTTKEAEQFIAVLQIYLAEIARYDLCLLRTKVHIWVEVTENEEIAIEAAPSNRDRLWRVCLPQSGEHSPRELGKSHLEVFAVVNSMLLEISLLPKAKFKGVTESLIEKGLTNKIFVAHPYEAVYREFVREEDFNQYTRNGSNGLLAEIRVTPFEHRELRWRDEPGPTYDWAAAERALTRRYELVLPSIRYTLPRLLKLVEFRTTIDSLRKKGWLDWHILTAVSGATVNERLNRRAKDKNDQRELRRIIKTLEKERKAWVPVPKDIFEEGVLFYCLHLSMLTTTGGVGLEIHQLTPDFEAIEQFLGHRYNYWTDDIPHADPFLAAPERRRSVKRKPKSLGRT
jgi:hypothetical protein